MAPTFDTPSLAPLFLVNISVRALSSAFSVAVSPPIKERGRERITEHNWNYKICIHFQ